MANTPTWSITYPTTANQITPLATHFAALAESADAAITAAVDQVNAGGAAFRGLDAAKGAAGQEGRTYYSTDTNRTWFDDGTNWISADVGSYLVTPSSVTGGTVSGGKVELTTGNTVTVNGVFSSRFRSYRILLDATLSAVGGFTFLLTSGGTPSNTSYYVQYIYASGTGLAASYAPNGASWSLATYSGLGHQHELLLTNPGSAVDTYYRSVDNVPTGGFWTTAGFHDQSTAYDGFRLTHTGTNFTSGQIAVYGLA